MGAMNSDDLYGLALDRFIPERAALAKALRADKHRHEAVAVAALRKPSVAAWAVNQLVRTQPDGVRELFAAGDELRDAQARLLAGTGDGRALRVASDRERAAGDELVRAARGLLSSDGHELSPAVVERVADTLHAAALDEDAREQVRSGRLERELRHIGLGLGESADPFSAAPPADDRRAAREQAQRDRADRERQERERAGARNAARTAEAAARRRVERAGHALTAAEERRARAATALEQADEAVAAAQAEAQDAVAAREDARAQLDAL